MGELYIGGAGVGKGYRHREDLTASQFVELELVEGKVERLYRTGDRVRWQTDGNLRFGGRSDEQVKIRGYRIELEEIESALQDLEVISAASVVLGEYKGEKTLVGYVVLEKEISFEEIRLSYLQACPIT